MIINKSYRFRLYPDPEQIPILKQHAGNSRYVWNKLLEYSNGKTKFPNQSELQKQVIHLKSKNEFLKLSYSQPLQVNAMRMANTFTRAMSPKTIAERKKKIAIAYQEPDPILKEKAIDKALRYGFPQFKSKARSHDSIFYPQHFKIKKSRIWFPKLGWLNYIQHRKIKGKPKQITITQDGDQWYASITTETTMVDHKPELNNSNIIGIDVGLTTFATLSNGDTIKNPRHLKPYLKKLRKESRKLARQELKDTDKKSITGKTIKASSSNRNKQVLKLQIIHRKIRNIRKDFIHKSTHDIITKCDGVVVEGLSIQDMLKKNGKAMNRNVMDASWYEFTRCLEYKSILYSKHFVRVDQYFPSTQLCHGCKHQMHLSLKDRTYVCPNCGLVRDRDSNASLNLRDEGIRILKEKERDIKNTVATTEIEACGSDTVVSGMKQENLCGSEEIQNSITSPCL